MKMEINFKDWLDFLVECIEIPLLVGYGVYYLSNSLFITLLFTICVCGGLTTKRIIIKILEIAKKEKKRKK